jgi:choline dehydrogenase-like flavoprotein
VLKLSPRDLDNHPPLTLTDEQRRRALAFAEAIIPGNDAIRAADERTLALTERVVEHASPWIAKLFGVGIDLLDNAALLSTGRRFSALPEHDQQRLLERWEKDPVLRGPLGALAFVLKFTHFDRPEVYGAMGGKLNVVTNLEQPRWLSQVIDAGESDAEDDECEVVVVGTGAGGAVVGRELAERGFAVAYVEEGKHHRRDVFTGSSIQAHFDFYRASLTLGNCAMPIFMGRLVGGSTAINTGSCFRTPPWVLDRFCEELESDEFSPARMDAHFSRVERTLEVGPADLKAAGPIASIMARGCDALGWKHARMLRNAPGCDGDGFCDFGCRTDARKSTNLSYVPAALEKGAMLFTGLRATKVLIENGRAVGIEGVDEKHRTHRVHAKAVVFSGGALPTPVFLLRQGICNSSGQLGRNLTVHPSTGFSALMDEEVNGHKHIPQGYFVEEHIKSGILINAAQPDKNFNAILFPVTGHRLMNVLSDTTRHASWGVLISDARQGGVVHAGPGGFPVARYTVTPADCAKMHRALVHTGEMAWAAGAKKVYPVNMAMPVVENRAQWERFKKLELKATDMMLTSYHPLGTCRMGRDPKTSVVGLDHQTHDVKGLYLVDGSTVSGPLGVNPQITIMAMATRAAGCIADALG